MSHQPTFLTVLISICVCCSSVDASPFILEEGSQTQYRISAEAFNVKQNETVSIEMQFEGAMRTLSLQRFNITDARTRFVVGDRDLDIDFSSIVLLRGTIDNDPDSSVFIAVSNHGAIGIAQVDHTHWSFAPTNNALGLSKSQLQWQRNTATDRPPLGVPICGNLASDLRRMTMRGLEPNQNRLRLDLAVETDYEYLELFSGDLDAAAEYIVALYGAVASIFDRDVDLELMLVYSRLWDTPDDLFNDDDPFNSFINYWNANMEDVDRDLAQFLTGRTNLPYGGVAAINATCSSFGYSVAGYILGSFHSATEPHFGNWDVIVTAHELGHNCGTYHTHDYGLDECASGVISRGSIMSYCHTTTGGNANIDLRFHTYTAEQMRIHLESSDCLEADCNGNGIPDNFDILVGFSDDFNFNGLPDECEDCNQNGVLDPTDISSGFSQDMNTNGIPDECEADCNANGIPDRYDITQGTSEDLWGNGIPDECEADCDSNGVSDYNQIQANMQLDINRNALLDSCEDCDSDGTPDHIQLVGSRWIWIAGSDENALQSFHPSSGVPIAQTTGTQVTDGRDVCIDGQSIFVSDGASNRVVVFDSISQSSVGVITSGLALPEGIVVHDNQLFVVSRGTNSVEKYDVDTFAHLGSVITAGTGGLSAPRAITITTDNALLVTSAGSRILEFSISGVFIRELVSANAGGLTDPRGILQRPNGSILVTSYGTNEILEYDRITGAYLGRFDRGGLPSGYWGLGNPWAIRLSPDGDVYVSTHAANTAIQLYEESTGLFKRRFYILSQLVGGSTGFAFAPSAPEDCNGNGILDSCDIESGVSDDINNDGIPDECQCVTDIDGDGATNVNDVLAVIAQWGATNSPADINGDGIVDVGDLLMVIGNWGPCE